MAEAKDDEHVPHGFLVGLGLVVGVLVGLMCGILFGLHGERQEIWRQGFTIGELAESERNAREQKNEPLANWYRANRLMRPQWDWDRKWTDDYINQK